MEYADAQLVPEDGEYADAQHTHIAAVAQGHGYHGGNTGLVAVGLGLGNLLGGMVLVETIFNWPGVGQFAYESVLSVDFPSIIGVALLIALNYMVINTVVDILYGIIDPRVRCS